MATLHNDIHIQAPELLTAPERRRDTLITAAMWLAYLYLWVPLLSLGAWLLGFEFAYDVMIRSGGIRDLGGILIVYAAIVCVIICAVTLWSLINRARFRGVKRRKSAANVSLLEMAQHFDLEEESVRNLRASKRSVVGFDDQGKPIQRSS